MKKIFTFGIFLFLLFGIGNNVSAAQFTANTGIKPGTWNSRATWYPAGTDTTTVANFPLPTYLDDVTIPAGDSIYLGAAGTCKSLNLSGTLCMFNGTLNVNGDITVNAGGVLSLKSNVACSNLYNYGKVWCYNTNANGSPKSLFIGYTYAGTSVAGTGDYTILNDGIIGWYRTPSLTSSVIGSGFYVIYSNLSKSLTIKHSDGVTSGYVFTASSLYPDTKTGVNQDFNLDIKESIALLKNSSQPTFTLTNGDAFTGYNRTCTIYPNDTVFVAGGFHVKGGSSQPSANVGNMTYNVYGCLDVATLHPGSTYNEFNLGATSFASNTGTLTFNLGDGTLSNAGTLILGKTIKMVRTSSNQPITFNTSTNSTVKFGYTSTTPAFTLTTAGVTDNTLFPSAFNNLAIINTAASIAVTMPNNPSVSGNLSLTEALNNTVTLNGTTAQTITGGSQAITALAINNQLGATLASALRVRNALTLTSGNVTLGSSNLISGSISGGQSSSYVVTSGTGALSTNAATSGTLFPIGTATGYAPVTITPASNDTVSAQVSATPTGTFTGYAVNTNEWTLTPQIATTAALAFTPTTASNTTSPVIFSGTGYAATTAATISGNTYSASGISLAASATPFATGGTTVATAIESNTSNNVLVYSANSSLVVKNAKEGEVITVYGVTGVKVVTAVVNGDNTTLTLAPGAYIVKVGSTTKKVLVQ